MLKKCKQCFEEKELSEFNKEKRNKDKLRFECKICFNSNAKISRDARTPEQLEIRKNRETIFHRKKYATDVNYRLKSILRCRLRVAIKHNYKSGSAVEDLGCSIEEFKKYIESKFEPWMNWENHGPYDKNRTTWHLDHILPLFDFNLSNRDELLKACHYSNIQPLRAEDNVFKSNKQV